MPTIKAPKSQTIPLAAGERLVFDQGGSGIANVLIGSGPRLSVDLGQSPQALGPYAQAASISVSAVRDLAYSVQANTSAEYESDDLLPVYQAANGELVGRSSIRPWLTDYQPARFQELRSGRSTVGWSLANNSSATGSMAMVANSPFGGPALRVTIPDDVGSVDIIADDLGLSNFTAGRANIVWHVFVEDELAIKQFQVHAGNDTALTRNITNTYNLSNNNLNRANGHHIGSLNPDNATANTLLTTDQVNRFRLRFFGQPSGGGATRFVWIGGVYIPKDVQPWMIVTVDDSDVSMWNRFHPELASRGLRGTFAIDWDNVGTNPALFVSQSQLQLMYDYGHDICSHNRANTAYPDENPPTAQPSDADRLTYCTAFRFTRNLMRELGWDRALGYHPFVQGAHDGALVDAMKAHGASVMRTTGAGNVVPYRADLQSVFRQRQLGNGFSLATARGWVDAAATRREDFFLMGHVLADTASSSITWAQADFAALLDYAAMRGVRVGSISQWAETRGVVV